MRLARVALVCLVLCLASSVFATVIVSGGITLPQTQLFDAEAGAMGQWGFDVPSTTGFLQGSNGSTYSLSGVHITWRASDLTADNSSSGQALGDFGSESDTLTLTGTIIDLQTFMPIYTGLILEASIDDGFTIIETYNNNVLYTQAMVPMTATGGELATGQQTGLILPSPAVGVQANGCFVPGGGDVTGFALDISCSTAGSQVMLIPEPAVFCLMVTGVAAMWRSRRR